MSKSYCNFFASASRLQQELKDMGEDEDIVYEYDDNVDDDDDDIDYEYEEEDWEEK